MASEGAQHPGIDAFRPDPQPGIPKQLQASFRLWLVAVAAGASDVLLTLTPVSAEPPAGNVPLIEPVPSDVIF